MASLRFMLFVVSILYCVSVFLLLLNLPTIQHQLSLLQIGHSGGSETKPFIHPHVLYSRQAQERCANLSRFHKTYEKSVRFFTIPKSRVSVMKAYHDQRIVDKPYVRLIVLMPSEILRVVNIHCHIPVSIDRMYTVPAVLYQFNENHGMIFGGYIFSCPLPPRLATDLPLCMVRITDGSSSSLPKIELPLEVVPRTVKQLRNLSICVPPLFGYLDPKHLIEFIEFNRILGVQHFYFYDLMRKRDNDTQKVLNHYNSLGLVTVKYWSLPVGMHTIWYKGQMLAIHHCLYANMGVSKYTAFQDLDEAFVPRKHPNLISLLQDIDSERRHCGFRFFSAFFPSFYASTDKLTSLRSRRTRAISRIRTKCIVRPDLIFEMGIHHISKQNVEEKTPHNIREDILLLHHFRECDSSFSMNCNDVTQDDTVERKFAALLQKHYRKTVNQVLGGRIMS